jgi:hypothetical protein
MLAKHARLHATYHGRQHQCLQCAPRLRHNSRLALAIHEYEVRPRVFTAASLANAPVGPHPCPIRGAIAAPLGQLVPRRHPNKNRTSRPNRRLAAAICVGARGRPGHCRAVWPATHVWPRARWGKTDVCENTIATDGQKAATGSFCRQKPAG